MREYTSLKQYIVVNKARLFNDNTIEEQAFKTNDIQELISLGRKLKDFDSNIWDEIKYDVVLNGLYLKFTQNKNEMKYLLDTADKLIVAQVPNDYIWGAKLNGDKWTGKNLLGRALMDVRDEIRKVWENAHLCVVDFHS